MSKPTKYYSELQENRISGYLGWHTVVGSGATPTKPGDIYSEQWLGECKTHTKKSDKVVFKLEHWLKIKKEAQSKFKYPVLFVDNGTQDIHYTWCLIDYSLCCPLGATLVNVNMRPATNSITITATIPLQSITCPIIQVGFTVTALAGNSLGIVSLFDFYKYFC